MSMNRYCVKLHVVWELETDNKQMLAFSKTTTSWTKQQKAPFEEVFRPDLRFIWTDEIPGCKISNVKYKPNCNIEFELAAPTKLTQQQIKQSVKSIAELIDDDGNYAITRNKLHYLPVTKVLSVSLLTTDNTIMNKKISKKKQASSSSSSTKKKQVKTNKKISTSTKKSNKKKECVEQHQKKYTTRPSPPYPAQACTGKTMEGNDGNIWRSISNVRGVYTWRKQ